jgi:LAO/AO transport system kinase
MWSTVDERLVSVFRHRPEVRAAAAELEVQLAEGTITPALAAQRLLAL